MARILIIGDDLRSFLSVIRSLGQAKHEIHVLPERFNGAALKSRYITKIHSQTPVFLGVDQWLKSLENLIQSQKIDLIIPCTDQALIPLLQCNHSIPLEIIASPPKKAFETFLDKVKTHQLCDKLEIPTAPYYEISQPQPETPYWPKFLKPKKSFTIDCLTKKHEVIKLNNQEEFTKAILALKNPNDYFIEDNFDGIGIGISVLASKGQIIHAFQHQRITEGESGGSSVRISKPIHPQMFETVIKMAASIQLDGVSMFEFRYNKSQNTFILLEVNARFWGSLPLALFSGVNFPKYLVDQMMSQKSTVTTPNTSYKINRIARAFIPSIYGFRIKNHAKNIFEKLVLTTAATLHSMLRQLIGREKIDSFSVTDPLPFFMEFGEFLKTIWTKIINKLGADIFPRKRQLRNSPIKKKKPVTNIVIVCYGNICRSPFLEVLLKNILPNDKYTISSVGFHTPEGRKSPTLAIDAAQDVNISLQNHRSHYCHHHKLDAADLILYFDQQNYAYIQAFHPKFISKALCVGNYLPHPQDIEDPFTGNSETFETCYKDISLAALSLVKDLEGSV